MASMTFQVNDQSTTTTGQPAIWVTLTEDGAGGITITTWITGSITGDLRGVFFDIADPALAGHLEVDTGAPLVQGVDSVKNLGDGSNLNGLLGSDGGYDAGVLIGTAGIGSDDIQAYTFTVSSDLRAMTLADFANMDFGVRTTSVGTLGGSREGSSKLLETTFRAIDAVNDQAWLVEDQSAAGNVLTNDSLGLAPTDVVSVTGWSGGALGTDAVLVDGGNVTVLVRLNSDGSYAVDATGANALSQGETLSFAFTYDARNQNEATSWATDTAAFTVTVQGTNDAPTAQDDALGTIDEGASLTGNTAGWIANDTDPDRLDVLTVTGLWDPQANTWSQSITTAKGGTVTLGPNGTFSYAAGTAFDALAEGDTDTDSFVYRASDGYPGGDDTATVSLTIVGHGTVTGTGGGGGSSGTGQFPTMAQAISNVVLYLDDGDANTPIYKVKITPTAGTYYDVDDLLIDGFLDAHALDLGTNTSLVGISIHAGTEYPQYPNDPHDLLPPDEEGTRHGEGPFYLVTPDATYAPVGSAGNGNGSENWTVDSVPLSAQALAIGLSNEVLLAHNNADYSFAGTW